MMPQWNWIAFGGLTALLVGQQILMYRHRRESKQREELFQIVTENAADMIALVDVKGRRLYNSPAYKRVLGYSAAELGETSAFEQIHPDDRFQVLEAAQEARSTGVGKKLEYRIRHKDGTWRVLESVASTIRDQNGAVSKLVIVNRDVTERKRAQEQLEHNSFHDALTGLPNRRLFLERLQHLFLRAQRNPERRYAVLLVDLDHFKLFNDTMGPAIGDRVIVEIGLRLGACLRAEDTVTRVENVFAVPDAVLSRMGGDEFTLLIEDLNDPSNAMRVAKRVVSAVAEPLFMEGQEVKATASVGIALSVSTHKRAEDLLLEADVAMRRAKGLGGSRCEVFDETMHNRAVTRLKLEADLRKALEAGQFRILYQPILQLESRKIIAFEALLRWEHPEQGLIAPDKFMAAAEDSGLLVDIGQWVIQEACRQLCTWESQVNFPRDVGIHVNISARQLAHSDFVARVAAALRSSGLVPSALSVEMTEEILAGESRQGAGALAGLRQLGVGLILEDFGAGNSSLNGLRQLPIRAVKIDRPLIGEMLADRGTRDTVDLILLLAHKLKLKVIAEGIESAKQLEILQQAGCELGQGYFFSPPVEAKAAEELLRKTGARAKVAGAE
jgi:diguanylate cyclase (GGDEF)-like protein/PAS domain S-box-containing protein